MRKTITITTEDVYLFLISAVRYALGSRSYIAGWACRQVRAIAPKLEACQREMIIESIRRCKDYGIKYDKKSWLELLDWLESYDSKKNKAKR